MKYISSSATAAYYNCDDALPNLSSRGLSRQILLTASRRASRRASLRAHFIRAIASIKRRRRALRRTR